MWKRPNFFIVEFAEQILINLENIIYFNILAWCDRDKWPLHGIISTRNIFLEYISDCYFLHFFLNTQLFDGLM